MDSPDESDPDPLSSFDHPISLTRRSVSVAYPFALRHDSITLAAVVLAREGAKRRPFLAAAPCPQRKEEGGGVAIDEIDDGTGGRGFEWVGSGVCECGTIREQGAGKDGKRKHISGFHQTRKMDRPGGEEGILLFLAMFSLRGCNG